MNSDDQQVQQERARIYNQIQKQFGPEVTNVQLTDFFVTEMALRKLEIHSLLSITNKLIEIIEVKTGELANDTDNTQTFTGTATMAAQACDSSENATNKTDCN